MKMIMAMVGAVVIAMTGMNVRARLVVTQKISDPGPRGTLRQLVAEKCPQHSVYVGAACGLPRPGSPEERILRREFNYITPNNDFKQHHIHPRPGKWDWKNADAWIKFARQNHLVIRIHGPISPQCSKWAKDDRRTAAELKKNLSEYMTALCQRYNGCPEVKWMDVVNETVDNSGKWKQPQPGNDKWENPWPQIGMERNIPSQFTALQDGVPLYIIQAFTIAKQQAPRIKLVINQQGRLNDEAWDKIKDLVLYLRFRGLRVDGIGWQGHIRCWHGQDWGPDSKNIKFLGQLIDWAHKNGLQFHLTETNIHDRKGQPDRQKKYAEIFANIFKTLIDHRNTGVVTWNTWGINDGVRFQNKSVYTHRLWDKNYQPNLSYRRIQRILEDLPTPAATKKPDSKPHKRKTSRMEAPASPYPAKTSLALTHISCQSSAKNKVIAATGRQSLRGGSLGTSKTKTPAQNHRY